MGTLTFSKSCASWDLSLLCTVWLSKSIISTPILQTRKRRLDPSLPAMKLTRQGHHTAALLEQMRCESSLQTLLSVKGGSHQGHPRGVGVPTGAVLRGSQKTVLCFYSETQSLKDPGENFIHALGGMHATCKCRNSPKRGEHLVQGHTVSRDGNPSRVQLALPLVLCPFSIPNLLLTNDLSPCLHL